jgi:glycosyltransferase involved in cell wall biosynthesis
MRAHILIVADGRSPTARHWIENIQGLNYRVSLISSFPCERPPDLAHFHVLPIAFSRYSSGDKPAKTNGSASLVKSWVRRFTPIFQTLRYHLGPLTISRMASDFQAMVAEIQPDLVHALRIPFEGMLASYTPEPIPLIAAIWGNDLTLHTKGSWLMRRWTHRCLNRADGLSADAHRDLRLAKAWGLKPQAPTLVIPGSGGLDLAAIQNAGAFYNQPYGIPDTGQWIVNPRGLRPGSVHQKAFFSAIPEVLVQQPEAVFICPGLRGKPTVEAWVQRLGIGERVFLLPPLPQRDLWSLMKRAPVFVSPSSHDGTPNSFLEALACGCFPVVGDIESLREWVHHQQNGLLVDSRDPSALADAMLWALDHPQLREDAQAKNLAVIKERAAQQATRPQIDGFYAQFLKPHL